MQEGRESRKHGEKEAHEVRKHIRHDHRPLDRGVRNLADFKISMVSLMLPSIFLYKMEINNLHKSVWNFSIFLLIKVLDSRDWYLN